MADRQPLILGRSAELAVAATAVKAAVAGHGALVLIAGPAGIGKTTVLGAACAEAEGMGVRVLSARGLAMEKGFPFGIVRQLLEPARAAVGSGEWDALFGGAAALARRVFDGSDGGAAGDDVPHATTHGLYWLIANLAAKGPLVIAVDDAHWADASSLRWLVHLAARVDRLPVAVLLGTRSGPDEPEIIGEVRRYPATSQLDLSPLSSADTAELVRAWFDGQAGPELCQAAYQATGGNPYLLDALAKAARARGRDALPDEMTLLSLGPQPVADAVLRHVAQLEAGAVALTRALAVLGRPAPLRHVASLTGTGLAEAARFADVLRAASVLAPSSLLEFEHPIVRTAIYDSIPPGERALTHSRAAALLEAEGADTEVVALHVQRSEPAGDQHAVEVLLAAAAAASGRGAPDAAAGHLRRALAEPPPAEARPKILLDLGLALASDRDPAGVAVLGDAVDQATDEDRPTAALRAAGVLGIWGHHESAAASCLAALTAPSVVAGAALDPLVRARLEAELLANSWVNPATAAGAWERARPWLDRRPGSAADGSSLLWGIYDALSRTLAGDPGTEAMARLDPVRADPLAALAGDTLAAFMTLLVLLWNDELPAALAICETVLDDARRRGSMTLMANVSAVRCVILRRLGKLRDAAANGRTGLEYRLGNSPPLGVAWAACFTIEALARLGRFDEAEEVAAAAEARRPADGWLHTVLFTQARGALRVSQQRHEEGLRDLYKAAADWRALGISSPSAASWRVPAVVACRQTGHAEQAARLAAEQLELARAAGNPGTLGVALRAAAPFSRDPEGMFQDSLGLLEAMHAEYEHAFALVELGAHRRRSGRRAQAQGPLRRALEWAERAGAEPLAGYARVELRSAGARPRRSALTGPDALTSAERQVAELAAGGMSNRQIAQQLFVTQATVETHLRHTFHKLGINSRVDLPARLGRPGQPRRGAG